MLSFRAFLLSRSTRATQFGFVCSGSQAAGTDASARNVLCYDCVNPGTLKVTPQGCWPVQVGYRHVVVWFVSTFNWRSEVFKKRYVAAAACALAMVGTASAVQVSRDGTGDFLIAPAYFIGGGMSTDLKVINTSNTESVVAKVVFRDQVTSAEVLDFLIYLSPSDVWTGKVSCEAADANGQCTRSVVTSADDSIQLEGSVLFASPSSPAHIVSDTATAGTTGRVSLPNQGYVEVLMGSAYSVAPFRPGVAKTNILAAHEAAAALVPVTATPNVLTGNVTVSAPGVGSATLPMLALADYDNSDNVRIGRLSGLDLTTQRTPVGYVEEALWSNNFAIPYSVGAGKLSLATFTFPTKLTYNARQDGQYPFAAKTCITANVFDNMENTIVGNIFNVSPLPPSPQTCLDEFQWLVMGGNINTGNFSEGWARISFQNPYPAAAQTRTAADSTNVGRAGAPAIATYMIKDTAANRFTWAYASTTR